ncbi:GNL3L/Grn1 putative GTPase [Carpediemonas membranifera]|uniref:GNL3L/Grn1 putative GTPase n=1 Tax=Carpediemonas membranifera TaxID=201153 RepID=A0A8J6E402_9EUKA|nr:GNL3L/Grn1 putative GTPase [Carpediemonas membranifera]|eukprot:KAG9393847.1 GNL3L/Grn1 putative GTPase [Carpediemonas membranifera]
MVAKKRLSKKKSITLKRKIGQAQGKHRSKANKAAGQMRRPPTEKFQIPNDCPFKEEMLQAMLAQQKAAEEEKERKRKLAQKRDRKAQAAKKAQ